MNASVTYSVALAVLLQGTSAWASDGAEADAVDPDKSIYVVQRRAFSKKERFEISPVFFSSVNNKFVGHLGLATAVAYHFRENFAVEFSTTLPFLVNSYYSGLVKDVFEFEQLTPEAVDLKRMSYFNALGLQVSAFYGKLAFYGHHIDYDFYVTAGVGMVATKELCVANQGSCGEVVTLERGERAPDETSDHIKLSGNLGAGLRFFFSETIGMRLEIRDVVYSDRATLDNERSSDIRNNILVITGVSFLL